MRKLALLPLAGLFLSFNVIAQSRGLDFDDAGYSMVPKKAKLTRSLDNVPESASIKKYAPHPKSQGNHGTCTAWSVGYCGRTIVEAIKQNWTNKDSITAWAYSPAFLFRLLKPTDAGCEGGSSILTALELLKTTGDVSYKDLSDLCVPAVSDHQIRLASNAKIKDFHKIFDADATASAKIQAVKKSLSEKKPVIIGMICPPSFNNAKDVWVPKEEPLNSYGGHAMCVVGYDNAKEAFEIQNSWGTGWGNKGYIWVKYDDFANFVKYAFEMVDLPAPKPELADLSGQLKLVLSTGMQMPANLLMSTRGLSVVPAQTVPGPLTIYQVANSYSSGTRFRIYISNNEPAFVYAISSDLSNAVTKIFPYEDGISAALTDRKNDVAIPDEDHFIEFDKQPGKDFLCILYSKTSLDINNIISNITSQQGTFSERIYKVIGKDMVEPKHIKFSKDKIGFEGFSNGKSIVALMVEMDHK